RNHSRAAEARRLQLRHASRGAAVLLHHHRVDDVEFSGSALLSDVIPVLYDGNPAWPAPDVLWKMVDDAGATLFGTSPTYVAALQKGGFVPREKYKLTTLQSVTLAGSPVTPE